MRQDRTCTGLRMPVNIQIINSRGSTNTDCYPLIGPFASAPEAQEWFQTLCERMTTNPEPYPEHRQVITRQHGPLALKGFDSSDMVISIYETAHIGSFAAQCQFDIDPRITTPDEAARDLREVAFKHIREVFDGAS